MSNTGPTAASANTFWIRLGHDGNCSSCPKECPGNQCCPGIGGQAGIKRGRFQCWIYFPPENRQYQNTCSGYDASKTLPRTYPFYHGGKLLGVCSNKCPTGNKTDDVYNQNWTIRFMFREQGRLALLYSVPLGGFSLEPVPDALRKSCCPSGGCSTFKSTSTDQYWFATTDPTYHRFRMAEYTFNAATGISCCTQLKWPNGQANPIDAILRTDCWNFLMMHWNVEEGTVQIDYAYDPDRTYEDGAPTYTPSTDRLLRVLDTPKGTIPFAGKQGASSLYFQPFYGGSSSDWIPSDASSPPSSSSVCDIHPTPEPFFAFGDVAVYDEGGAH